MHDECFNIIPVCSVNIILDKHIVATAPVMTVGEGAGGGKERDGGDIALCYISIIN